MPTTSHAFVVFYVRGENSSLSGGIEVLFDAIWEMHSSFLDHCHTLRAQHRVKNSMKYTFKPDPLSCYNELG